MADADQVAVAKAVTTALNGGGFSQAFTAARAYRRRVKREDISGLLVTVVGNGRTINKAARRVSERLAEVSVVVQKKVDGSDVAAVDAELAFVQELIDFLDLEPRGDGSFVSLVNAPIFEPELIAENLFESIIVATYRVMVEK